MGALRSDLVQAIRGPIMLITLGALVSLDYFQGISFRRTWPVLLIVFGLMKLLEKSAVRVTPPVPPVNPGVYPGTPGTQSGGQVL